MQFLRIKNKWIESLLKRWAVLEKSKKCCFSEQILPVLNVSYYIAQSCTWIWLVILALDMDECIGWMTWSQHEHVQRVDDMIISSCPVQALKHVWFYSCQMTDLCLKLLLKLWIICTKSPQMMFFTNGQAMGKAYQQTSELMRLLICRRHLEKHVNHHK